ncbi:hypothetical protein SMC26_07965 [Actinomadura fulvescens]|uniref:DUF4235 domain-containing protein n=1 Tax=Actinomadura fulvescens TaxID=46160 RepID=A0ABN3PWQ8_9ACTN
MNKNARQDGAKRSATASLGSGLAGMVAGRALRPVARKIARRFGIPTATAVRMIEVAVPVAATVVAGRWAKHKERKKAPMGHEPPGAIALPETTPEPVARHP